MSDRKSKESSKASLRDEVFVCVDCETTGLDAEKDRIIEVAAIKFTHNEVIDQFESLIDPGCPIPEESIKIHNITDEMVAGKPAITKLLPEIIDFMGDHIVIGHGVKFDIDLLYHAAERAGIKNRLDKTLFFDTLRMARLYGGSPINSLEKLAEHFNVERAGKHRAMQDVRMNIEVFKHLARPYKTLKSLFDALARPIELKRMPLGKHKGRPLREIPDQYLRWAANKDFDQDLLFSVRRELKRRKQGNLFSQASNPFSDL